MKEKRLFDPIFRTYIIITFGSLDEAKKWYKNKGLEIPEFGRLAGYVDSIIYKNDEYHHIHFVLYGFTTIVHETNHLTWDILNKRGIDFNEETKEVFAYYQDWLAGQCRDILEKWTKRKRKPLSSAGASMNENDSSRL